MLTEFFEGLMVTSIIVSVRNPPEPKRWSEPNNRILICPFGCGSKPARGKLGLLIYWPVGIGVGVGGTGVAVG